MLKFWLIVFTVCSALSGTSLAANCTPELVAYNQTKIAEGLAYCERLNSLYATSCQEMNGSPFVTGSWKPVFISYGTFGGRINCEDYSCTTVF